MPLIYMCWGKCARRDGLLWPPIDYTAPNAAPKWGLGSGEKSGPKGRKGRQKNVGGLYRGLGCGGGVEVLSPPLAVPDHQTQVRATAAITTCQRVFFFPK